MVTPLGPEQWRRSLGCTGTAGGAAGVLALPDESEKGVQRGIHKVDRIVGAVGEIVLLRGVVDPTNVEPIGSVVDR